MDQCLQASKNQRQGWYLMTSQPEINPGDRWVQVFTNKKATIASVDGDSVTLQGCPGYCWRQDEAEGFTIPAADLLRYWVKD